MKLKNVPIIIISTYLLILTVFVVYDKRGECHNPAQTYVKLEQPEFINEPLSDSVLLKALVYYEIKEPLIVLAQAKLESANYMSRLCKEKNNLFGLYNSRAQQYYSFDHWTNCIIAYKNMIEYRYGSDEDYYQFLLRIKYAEDKDYIGKVKSIVNNFPSRDD